MWHHWQEIFVISYSQITWPWLSMKFNFTKFSADTSEIQCCNNLLAHSSYSLSFSSCVLSLSFLSIFLTQFFHLLFYASHLLFLPFLLLLPRFCLPRLLFLTSLASCSLASLSSLSTSLLLLSASACFSSATSLVRDFTHSSKSAICCSIFTRFWLQNWKNNLMSNILAYKEILLATHF